MEGFIRSESFIRWNGIRLEWFIRSVIHQVVRNQGGGVHWVRVIHQVVRNQGGGVH